VDLGIHAHFNGTKITKDIFIHTDYNLNNGVNIKHKQGKDRFRNSQQHNNCGFFKNLLIQVVQCETSESRLRQRNARGNDWGIA
jgi:hypothetical protein